MKVNTCRPGSSGLWQVLLVCGHSRDDVQSVKQPREAHCEQCEKPDPSVDDQGQSSLFQK